MDAELLRLLQYLDQDGVTEIVLGTGQPLTLRRSGAYTAVSTELVTRAHIGRWLLGSGFEVAMPDGEGFGEPADVDVGARRYAVQITRRADDVIVRIELAKVAPPPPSRTKSRAVKTPALATPVVPAAAAVAVAVAAPPPAAAALAARAAEVPVQAAPVAPARPPQAPPAPGEVNFNVPSVLELGPPDSVGPPGIEVPAMTATAPAPATAAPPGGEVYEMLPDLMPDVPLAVAMATPPPAARSAPRLDASKFEPPPAARVEAARVEVPRTITKTPPAEAPVPRAPATPRTRTADQVSAAVAAAVVAAPVPVAAPAPVAPAVARTPTPHNAPRARSLRDADEKPNTHLIAKVVRAARQRGASDIHIAANRPLLVRAMGDLIALDPAPLPARDVEQLLMPLLGVVSREMLAARGYVDLAIEIPDAGRMRGNVSRVQGGLKGSFRLAYARPPTLEELNLPKELAKVVAHHQGLVVFAGPSGHGKTTTLAALVDLINSTRPHHILTIEDPVEVEHPRKRAVVTQREVGRHTRSFAAALKASLREDPDVIVIGELRDRETVEIALTAAETGHLVLATMSTPSAAKTIDRLIDMFPPDDQQQVRSSLGGALRAIVAQRLLPRIDGGAVLPAIELLTGVLPLVSLIRDNKLFQLPNLMQRGRAFGMIRLDDSLAELVRGGLVAEEAALRASDTKRDLLAALRGGALTSSASAAAATVGSATPPTGTAVPAGSGTSPGVKKGIGGLFGRKDRE